MRKVLLRLAMVLVGLLLGVVLIEGGLRISGQDPIGRITQMPRPAAFNEACFELDDDLGFRARPDVCGANALGFLDRPVKEKAGPRVLVLGDSISAERMFPDFLEEMLTQQHGTPIDVVNTGIPGYSTRNQLAVYERHAGALAPDVVVLQFCLNDYIGTPFLFHRYGQIIQVRDERSSMWGRSSWWFSRSALYRYLTLHADNLSGERVPLEDRYANAEDALHTLHAALGERLVVVVFPMIVDRPWQPGEEASLRRIISTLQTAGITHIDLTEPFLRGGGERLQRRFAHERYADLPGAVVDWQLPGTAVRFIEAQSSQMMKVNQVFQGIDTTHPGFLGHYIAAHEIAALLAEKPGLLE